MSNHSLGLHFVLQKCFDFFWIVSNLNSFKTTILLFEFLKSFVHITNIKEYRDSRLVFPDFFKCINARIAIPIISLLSTHVCHKDNFDIRIIENLLFILQPLFELISREDMFKRTGLVFIDLIETLSCFFGVRINPNNHVWSDHR